MLKIKVSVRVTAVAFAIVILFISACNVIEEDDSSIDFAESPLQQLAEESVPSIIEEYRSEDCDSVIEDPFANVTRVREIPPPAGDYYRNPPIWDETEERPDSAIVFGRVYYTDTTGISVPSLRIISQDIVRLRHFWDLTDLRLWNNWITCLTPIAGLTNLKTLDLGNNRISDLTPLANMTELRTLILNGNRITDLTPLSGLTNLTTLILCDNQIIDLSPLSTLTNLTVLELDSNQIIDVTPISGLTTLEELTLNNNQIRDMTSFADLVNLRYLGYSENPISDTSGIYVNNIIRENYVNVGEVIEFGDFTWVVLDVQDNQALIITEYLHMFGVGILDYFAINTWEGTTLRKYLNGAFVNNFRPSDRARIQETYVINENNQWFGTDGGRNTIDRIFLLSVAEVVRYFGDSGILAERSGDEPLLWLHEDVSITWLSDEYDSARVATFEDGTRRLAWLRSPGGKSLLATAVCAVGTIHMYGISGWSSGAGARPAMWVSFDAVSTARDWETFTWELENLSEIREPLHLEPSTPHGYLAIQHIRFMNDNLYGRKPFTYREKEAAVWLVEELLAMGHPWENISVQEYSWLDIEWWSIDEMYRRWDLFIENRFDWSPAWRRMFEFRSTTKATQNVILTIPGQSDRILIVGAHYDAWPTPGAADNASGTSLLLESAQRMLQMDNYYTIMYVFLGAHESGGFATAFHFIRNLTYEQRDNIVLYINADALFDGPYMFFGAGYFVEWFQPPGSNELTQKIDLIAYELDLGIINHPPVALLGSDNAAFANRGYTVVHMTGLTRLEHPTYEGFFRLDDAAFTRSVSHTSDDCYHYIQERWPGMIETNMRAFSIFLEALLMMR